MFQNNKLFFYVKLFLILPIVYFISFFLIKNVFLANSPKIDPNVGTNLLAKIKNTINNSNSKLAVLFNRNTNNQETRKKDNNFANNFGNFNIMPVAKGVSAYTKDGVAYRVYELDKVEWEEIKYTLKNGKEVTLKIPKGQSQLSQEDMEEMYQ